MKDLPTTKTANGFVYEQIEANEKGFIYSQKNDGKVIAFEVFERRENDRYGCVSWPSDKAFGLWAWTYHNLGDAKAKLATL